MKAKEIKTIDVNALEWFDKVNGNSYFSGTITLNFGMPDSTTLVMPFQYGYGDQYLSETMNVLKEENLLNLTGKEKYMPSLWRYCEENNIILRYNKVTGCKKRELKTVNA